MNSDTAKESYRRLLNADGETITIRRYAGMGGSRAVEAETAVIARVSEFRATELIGAIQQGDRKIILLAEDFEQGDIASPIRKGDKAVVRGRELNIEAVDDNTRRIQGVLIAYELQVRG